MHNCPNCGIALRKYEDFAYGNVTISKNSDILYNGEKVRISGAIRMVAENLIRAQGRVLDRDVLLSILDSDADHRTIDVYIRRARLAFQEVDPTFDQLPVVRGMGYRFDKKETAAAPVEQQPFELRLVA